MNRKWLPAALAVAGVVLASQASAANVVHWQATGTIDNVWDSPSNLLDDTVQVNDTFTFNFDIDLDAGGINVFGVKTYSRPGDAQVGVESWSSTFNSVSMGDSVTVADSFLDGFGVTAISGTSGPGVQLANISLIGPNNIFNSNALPTSALNVSAFTLQNLFTFALGSASSSDRGLAGFTGTLATVAPVPLPAAAWLLISGLGCLGAFARRRRRQPA